MLNPIRHRVDLSKKAKSIRKLAYPKSGTRDPGLLMGPDT